MHLGGSGVGRGEEREGVKVLEAGLGVGASSG